MNKSLNPQGLLSSSIKSGLSQSNPCLIWVAGWSNILPMKSLQIVNIRDFHIWPTLTSPFGTGFFQVCPFRKKSALHFLFPSRTHSLTLKNVPESEWASSSKFTAGQDRGRSSRSWGCGRIKQGGQRSWSQKSPGLSSCLALGQETVENCRESSVFQRGYFVSHICFWRWIFSSLEHSRTPSSAHHKPCWAGRLFRSSPECKH